MKWKEDEIEFLKENYDDKIPLEEISKKLKRSRKSVQRKAQNIGLQRKWVRFNKPTSKQPKNVIDRRYYLNNKEKVRLRRVKRRRKLKDEAIMLLGSKCKNCGYNKCFAALDFHHFENNKEGNIHDFVNYPQTKVRGV